MSVLRVLDIDLDFFLADVCPLAEKGARPCLAGHEPWDKAAVRAFLENKLHLRRAHPLPGRVFETHDGALRFWRELMREGRLSSPFDVTHIDAHSDLGIGKPGPGIVLGGALCQRMDVRCEIERYDRLKQLDEANYLLYALAFRWVKSLENVRNSKSRADMPREIVHSFREDGVPDALRLKPSLPELFQKMNGAEPVIPYREFKSAEEYEATTPFDFMSLAISPRYAPREADALVGVMEEYMVQC